MRLSGKQRQQLQNALIDAFPTKTSLEKLLVFRLNNKKLDAIAGGNNLKEIVFNLIKVANAEGWIEDLIRAALMLYPGNARLREVAEQFRTSEALPSASDRREQGSEPPTEISDSVASNQCGSEAHTLIATLLPSASCLLPSSAKHSRIRQALLKQVNLEVESRINSSLHNRVYVVLDLQQNPSQIELPWESEIKVANKPKILLKNTNIITVFDQPDIQGRLLILGQPGAGKTIMLLKLAEALVSRAKDESTYPVPVLFTLSSWKNDNQNIKDWLVEQLKDKYGLRKDIGKLWINDQKIIPLLDGLDELVAERQEKCVLKINEFLHLDNWDNPVIVCSRIQEYEHYKTLLQLNNSLELYPFSEQQISQYLENTGHSDLCNSIIHAPDLSQLVKTPLLLNLIVVSAQEISIQKWQEFKFSEERLSYLFNTYISRMLKRPHKSKDKQLYLENSQRWLSWLAYQLIEESTTEFLIEKMQPDWLKNGVQKIIYNLVVSGVIGTLIFGLIAGLIGQLIYGLIYGLISGLTYGLIYGLIGNLIENQIKKRTFLINLAQDFSITTITGLIIGLVIGLIGGLISGLTYGLIIGLSFALVYGLSFALIGGLSFALIGGLIENKIETIETLNFSLKNPLNWVRNGQTSLMIFILGLILIFWHIFALFEGQIGLLILLIPEMIIGISLLINRPEIENEIKPNQPIKQSFINTTFLSIVTSLFATLIIFIIEISSNHNINYHVLVSSLELGIFFGILIGILRSGILVIKHFILRVVLWSSGYSPWNYAKFLDYCTDRLFLQRVGGGYRFMHDLLRQHFAKSYRNPQT